MPSDMDYWEDAMAIFLENRFLSIQKPRHLKSFENHIMLYFTHIFIFKKAKSQTISKHTPKIVWDQFVFWSEIRLQVS